jgi:hypothetical protein
MDKRPQNRYPNAAAMRMALEWIEIESAKSNPQTQDIAPWMETSYIGSVPVASLASEVPPAHVTSRHPTGKVLSTSGPTIEPIVIEEVNASSRVHWLRIVLLLVLLGALVYSGYWYKAESAPPSPPIPLGLEPEVPLVE